MPKKKRRPTALGVHIFAGGFTVGVKQAGFRVLGHLEDTEYGVSTARLNWPRLDVRVGKENWQAKEFSGKVDFLYSNPPCAIFSAAGISVTRGPDAWREDPRLSCWHRAFGVFETVRPKVFALESVCRAYTKGREVVDDFTRRAVELGYSVQHVLMDAKWTGIPQSRKRFFFVAHRPETRLKLNFDFDRPPTVEEVIGLVKDPGHVVSHDTGANFAQWIEHTLPGKSLRESFNRLVKDKTVVNGRVKGRPGFMYYRLPRDGQMGPLTGDVFAHPTKNRFIGVEEMKVLCGYPETFQLDGNPRGHASLLARAVLPPVARWLGKRVRLSLVQPMNRSHESVKMTDLRKPDGLYKDITAEYEEV